MDRSNTHIVMFQKQFIFGFTSFALILSIWEHKLREIVSGALIFLKFNLHNQKNCSVDNF